MSITKYEVKCDKCGAVFPTSDTEITNYDYQRLVWKLKHLSEIGWKAVEKQKYYCPDCAKEETMSSETLFSDGGVANDAF